jgi:hypothetical protein
VIVNDPYAIPAPESAAAIGRAASRARDIAAPALPAPYRVPTGSFPSLRALS